MMEIEISCKSLDPNPLVTDEQLDGLRLGVAVHHAGVQEDYLKEVERLFRSRNLPLIIATGTLALGIHMPCRTVVLCGKSIYMTTTMFHQCSGRAGRRGFDNKGQVVIFDIPQIEVNRLLTAKNPKIIGSLGITVIREMKTLLMIFFFSLLFISKI
jgi:superfamily II RNA helicase